ncbi:hypothetical protein [Tenacibaculum aestuarii]|uniref:hypothetical protein n=1 Tax=Tenacibaculum aestuarii TaxID=362781 RepID=UPI003893EBCC
MSSEKEQDIIIRNKLWLAFMPILIVFIIASYFKTNSLNYKRKIYYEAKSISYSGVIIRKRIDKDFGDVGSRTPRIITLNSNYEKNVFSNLFDRLRVGDSVVKKQGFDSVYYYRDNKILHIVDELKYLREDYLVNIEK